MHFEFTVRLGGDDHDVVVGTPLALRLSEVWPRLLTVLGSPPHLRPGIDPAVVLGSRQLSTGALIGSAGELADAPVGACPSGDHPPGDLAVHIVGGRDAGRSVPLRAGSTRIGRDSHSAVVLDDERVSRHHVTIRADSGGVVLRDDASTNGTTIEGAPLEAGRAALPPGAIARLGDTLLSVHDDNDIPLPVVPCGDRQQVAHLPRPPDPVPAVLDLAGAIRRSGPRPTQWLAALLPAAAGGALAWLTHSPTFLLFALLSPVMLLGTALGDRLHLRRSGRVDDAERRARHASDEQAVSAALRAETAARRSRFPDPVAVGRAATVPTTRLWQRRRADDDLLTLRIGSAELPSSTMVRRDGSAEAAGRLVSVPITVDLRAGPVGLSGPPDVLDGVARCLVAQLAVLHPPGTVELTLLLSDSAGEARWWWARWLPHVGDRVARSSSLWGAVAARTSDAADGRWTVLVVDRAAGMAQLGELAGPVAGAGITGLVFADSAAALPAWCARTIDLWACDMVIDQVGAAWAERVARALAPLSDAAGDATRTPRDCHLLDVLDFATPTAAEVVARWETSNGRADTVLGLTADGRLDLDLDRDGPHVLVAGTTGSGKSELLRTFVLGLALQHPPDEISFVLIDYKGGAAFAECADLPHVAGSVTDLDPHLTRRALQSLEAELRRRERLFAEIGASDLEGCRRAGDRAPTRLVIVVDEFATLADTLPDVLRGLVSVAQRGRSLGVHLVLATQRPGTAVTPEVRANTGCRIALRVIEAAESTDVIGVPDAAALSPRRPGRALVSGAGAPVEFQTACVGGIARDRLTGVTVERLGPWRQRPTPRDSATTPCARIVDVVRLAAVDRGVRRVPGPWLAPLPDLLPASSLTTSGAHRLPLALVDLPGEQRQNTLEIDLELASSWLVVGGPRSGRTTTLISAALAAAGTASPSELEIYVIDCAGPLASALRDLPHVATCLGPDELAAAGLLLHRLAARPRSPARVLLLIDRAERVLSPDEDAAAGSELGAILGNRRATVLAAGSRALLTSRIAGGFEHRWVMRLADRADYALAGIAVRDVPVVMPPGRAVRVADAATLQVAFPGDRSGVAAVARRWRGARSTGAVRIRPLPRTLDLDTLPRHAGRLRLGVAGEVAEAVHVDPVAGSRRWLVAGPARSGRTTTLLTLLAEAHRVGLPVLVAAPTRSALLARGRELGVATFDPSSPAPEPPHGVPSLVLVDDCESFAGTQVDDALAGWARDAGTVSFVVSGRGDELAASYRGLAAEVRRTRSGLLLRAGPLDGELFDIRLPRCTDSPPGRGVLVGVPEWLSGSSDSTVDGAAPVPVQVARP